MCQYRTGKAKEAGRRKAFEILTEGADINELIRKYGLNVKDAEDKEFIMPDSINFAEYHDGNILISKRLLEVLEQKKETFARGIRRLQGVGRFVLP